MGITKGHLSDNGGIRGHSAGEFFPYIVFAKGIPGDDDFRWCVRHPSGVVMARYKDVKCAHACALMLKAGNSGDNEHD